MGNDLGTNQVSNVREKIRTKDAIEDTMLAFSTWENHTSLRDTCSGSIFIQMVYRLFGIPPNTNAYPIKDLMFAVSKRMNLLVRKGCEIEFGHELFYYFPRRN